MCNNFKMKVNLCLFFVVFVERVFKVFLYFTEQFFRKIREYGFDI